MNVCNWAVRVCNLAAPHPSLQCRSMAMFVSSWPMRFSICTMRIAMSSMADVAAQSRPGSRRYRGDTTHRELFWEQRQPRLQPTCRSPRAMFCFRPQRLVCDGKSIQRPECSLNIKQSSVQHSVCRAHYNSHLCVWHCRLRVASATSRLSARLADEIFHSLGVLCGHLFLRCFSHPHTETFNVHSPDVSTVSPHHVEKANLLHLPVLLTLGMHRYNQNRGLHPRALPTSAGVCQA